jgi:hypothetical protein
LPVPAALKPPLPLESPAELAPPALFELAALPPAPPPFEPPEKFEAPARPESAGTAPAAPPSPSATSRSNRDVELPPHESSKAAAAQPAAERAPWPHSTPARTK